jgi:hypothetical protein
MYSGTLSQRTKGGLIGLVVRVMKFKPEGEGEDGEKGEN